MKIAVGSDEKTHLTEVVIEELKKRGYQVILCGALRRKGIDWVKTGWEVAEKIRSGECEQGVLFCWTGTGVSIVANKLPGIKAALCFEAGNAKGARIWNDANILVMSLRLTSEEVAKEILEAWFSTQPDPKEKETVRKIKKIEKKYLKNR